MAAMTSFTQKSAAILPGARCIFQFQAHVVDDDDESISYVRPILQLQTVTSVLMIRSDEQFSFQIVTERGWNVAGGSCVAVLEESSTWTVLQQRRCEGGVMWRHRLAVAVRYRS